MPYERWNRGTPSSRSGGRKGWKPSGGGKKPYVPALPEREFRLAREMDLVEEARKAMHQGGIQAVRRLLGGA